MIIVLVAVVVAASGGVMTMHAWFNERESTPAADQGPEPYIEPDPEADGLGYVLLTFDDGAKSVYQYGYPIMSPAGINGTVFAVTDSIGGYFEGRQMMNAAELRDLQANGWEIGSHSKSHADFLSLPLEQAMSELAASKAALQANGIDATSFAYPWGRYDQADVAAAAEVYDQQRGGYGPLDRRGLNLQDYSPGIPIVGSVTPQSLEHAKQLIDHAVATDSVVIFLLHDVSPAGYLGTSVVDTRLQDLVEYIVARQRSDGLQAITLDHLPTVTKERYVWDGGGGDELASTKENWYKVNGTGDIVNDAPLATGAHYIWDATSSKNCTWDLDAGNLTARSFTIAPGYAGKVSQGPVDIALGRGGFYQGGGTFTGHQNRTVHSSGSVTVVGGTYAEGTITWDMTGKGCFQYISEEARRQLPSGTS